MNRQVHVSKFCDNIYHRYPILNKVTSRINTSSLVIQQSYLRPVWVIAKKFQSIWEDTLGAMDEYEDYRLYQVLEHSFIGLFECLRYVFSTITKGDSSELLKGMTIILPFLADEIIVPSAEYQSKCQWNIYHSMFANEIKSFIIDCYHSLPREQNEIDSMMQQIFGDDFYDKYQTTLYVFHYVQTLPDHFVAYPYDNEEGAEDDE